MFKYFKRLFKKPVDTIELLPKLLREGNSQLLQKVEVKPLARNVISDDLVAKLQYRQTLAKASFPRKIDLLKRYPW